MNLIGIDELKKQHAGKTVAILGNGVTTMASPTKHLDFSKEYEYIWTVNGGWINHPTSCLGFMMDDWASVAHDEDLTPRDLKALKLKEAPIPIMVNTVYPGFDNFLEYPLKEIIDYHKRAYFGETISYMVALAIMWGVEGIHLHGTDYMGCKPAERACTEFWAGVAHGKGIEIASNPNSHFLNTQLDKRNNHIPFFYGYIPETFPFKLKDKGNGAFELTLGSSNENKDAFISNYTKGDGGETR